MKKLKSILLLTIMLLPSIVFASEDGEVSLNQMMLFFELFITIHISIFFFMPLSSLLTNSKESKNRLFISLFILRIIYLVIGDTFLGFAMAIIDFVSVFIGAFIIVPVLSIVKKKPWADAFSSFSTTKTNNISECPNCGAKVFDNKNECEVCGKKLRI